MNHYTLAEMIPGLTEEFTVTVTPEMMDAFCTITGIFWSVISIIFCHDAKKSIWRLLVWKSRSRPSCLTKASISSSLATFFRFPASG